LMPGERTETATPRHLAQLRSKGQMARSNEFNTAIGILAATVTLRFIGPGVVNELQQLVQSTLLHPDTFVADPENVRFMATDIGITIVLMITLMLLAIM